MKDETIKQTLNNRTEWSNDHFNLSFKYLKDYPEEEERLRSMISNWYRNPDNILDVGDEIALSDCITAKQVELFDIYTDMIKDSYIYWFNKLLNDDDMSDSSDPNLDVSDNFSESERQACESDLHKFATSDDTDTHASGLDHAHSTKDVYYSIEQSEQSDSDDEDDLWATKPARTERRSSWFSDDDNNMEPFDCF